MTKVKKPVKKTVRRNIPVIYRVTALVIIAAAAIYFIFIYGSNNGANPDEEYMFKKSGELTVLTSSGASVKIDIQIARTEFDRQLGLMFRKSMNENQGMLFIFPDVRVRSFWMRNTEIPLDMIFVDTSKRIINIARNTTPYSDVSYPSDGPAKYVIEVNGGFSDRHNISKGDIVNWTQNN